MMNHRYSLIAFIVILVMLMSPSGVLAQEAGPTSPDAPLGDAGTWSTTDSMTNDRDSVYSNVAAGWSGARRRRFSAGACYRNSAEIYDPDTGYLESRRST